MGRDETPRNVQAESQPTAVALGALPESLEDRVELVFGYPDSQVTNGEPHLSSKPLDADCHARTRPTELDGVCDQVAEDLENPLGIEFPVYTAGKYCSEFDALALGHRLPSLDGIPHDSRSIRHDRVNGELPSVDARDIDQVAN